MSTSVIEISDLTKKYGEYTAVDKLNLSIGKGEVFGLLGPNGAGKSTTILMLMGLSESDSGSVKVCNINPERNPIRVKQKVGYLPEDVGFYDELSGFENLMYTARLNSISGKEAHKRSVQLLERVGLSEDIHKKVGKYSRGMRQRLGLADVLIKNPEVIILDEPTLGIDPTGVKAFLELIVQLSKEDGITVLFSSHHLHQVQQVCDRVGIFVKGRLLAEGNVDSLAKQLFNSGAYTIEVGLMENENAMHNTLLDKVKSLESVESVVVNDTFWRIECTQDIAHEISKTIVDSGVGLSHLYKKEYGLDDIYHRYFEGGNKDE